MDDEQVAQLQMFGIDISGNCTDFKLGLGFHEPEHGVLLVNYGQSKAYSI